MTQYDNSTMNNLPALPCYLNGAFTLLPDAKISVMDRGFIFGDGVYEVVPVYGGHLFRFAQHMARLDRSLAELRIANPLTHVQWAALANQLIANYAQSMPAGAATGDQLIYIQITRGVAMRDHVMPTDIAPTVFVMTNAMKLPSAAQRSQGVACVTADDFRWEKAHIKSTTEKRDALVEQARKKISADEARVIIIQRLGQVLMASFQHYLRADQRACVAAIENLWRKYAVTAKQIEAQRDAAAEQLQTFLL